MSPLQLLVAPTRRRSSEWRAFLIWFVQLVHYTLLDCVPAAGFAAYHAGHNTQTGRGRLRWTGHLLNQQMYSGDPGPVEIKRMCQRLYSVAALSVLFVLGSYGTEHPAIELGKPNPNAFGDSTVIMDSGRTEDRQWLVVNDGVMGGVSRSRIWLNEEGSAVFEGQLSLENNGGFASVRTVLTDLDLSAAKAVVLRVKGDGRLYQLRFRTDERFDGIAYRALFTTKDGEWTTVELPFVDFSATFRGRTVSGAEPLDPALIHQLAFLIADAREGPFRLEIDWVKAY